MNQVIAECFGLWNLNTQNGLLKDVLHESDEKEKKGKKKHEKEKITHSNLRERSDWTYKKKIEMRIG